jgi:hypothetical protein
MSFATLTAARQANFPSSRPSLSNASVSSSDSHSDRLSSVTTETQSSSGSVMPGMYQRRRQHSISKQRVTRISAPDKRKGATRHFDDEYDERHEGMAAIVQRPVDEMRPASAVLKTAGRRKRSVSTSRCTATGTARFRFWAAELAKALPA